MEAKNSSETVVEKVNIQNDDEDNAVNTVRIDDIVDEYEYAVAVRSAIDKHFRRPKDLMIEPELVTYALQTHDYHAMHSADRVKLNRIRNEVESVQNAISKGLYFQGRNPSGAIEGPICPICHNNLHERNPTSLARCGHVYCDVCITKVVRQHTLASKQPKCPKCRTLIEPIRDRRRIHLYYK